MFHRCALESSGGRHILSSFQRLQSSSSAAAAAGTVPVEATTMPPMPPAVVPFTVFASFRDAEKQAQVKPDGLEWDMPSGLSEICYVRYPPLVNDSSNTNNSTSSPHVRRGIVEAHNRWSFAKDLPFVRAEDIMSMEEDDQGHITVKWADDIRRPEKTDRYGGTVIEHLENDKAAKESSDMETAAAEVWMNGMYIGELAGPSTLQPLLDTVNTQLKSKKVCYRRSENLIRIEKYFHGMIRGWEIYEHLLDNLYAMEDAEILDEHTLIGTATLPDWIMGGMLTSRLWLSELPNGNILTQRPLQNDDLRTSDRRYELVKGKDDEKIAIVREELKRLRYLAGLQHPVEKRRQVNDKTTHVSEDDDDDEREPVVEESAVARQARINRRRAKMRM